MLRWCVNALAFATDAWIISLYYWIVRHPSSVRSYHWANAIGCLPLAAVEIMTGAWAVMPVTVAFGAIGWYGLLRGKQR